MQGIFREKALWPRPRGRSRSQCKGLEVGEREHHPTLYSISQSSYSVASSYVWLQFTVWALGCEAGISHLLYFSCFLFSFCLCLSQLKYSCESQWCHWGKWNFSNHLEHLELLEPNLGFIKILETRIYPNSLTIICLENYENKWRSLTFLKIESKCLISIYKDALLFCCHKYLTVIISAKVKRSSIGS